MKKLKSFTPKNRMDLRRWLSENQSQKESIWVVLFKKSSGRKNLTTEELTEEALCFGWIDSVPGKIDAVRYKLLLSPRKPKSVWSALNKRRVSRLIRAGLMKPAGLAKIKSAKANGAWSALERSDRLEAPQDLLTTLKKNRKAHRFFDSIPPSSKKNILQWIESAKTEQTRKKRVEETVRLAALGLRANHFRSQKNTPSRKTARR